MGVQSQGTNTLLKEWGSLAAYVESHGQICQSSWGLMYILKISVCVLVWLRPWQIGKMNMASRPLQSKLDGMASLLTLDTYMTANKSPINKDIYDPIAFREWAEQAPDSNRSLGRRGGKVPIFFLQSEVDCSLDQNGMERNKHLVLIRDGVVYLYG